MVVTTMVVATADEPQELHDRRRSLLRESVKRAATTA
jgi:hypothetical protein